MSESPLDDEPNLGLLCFIAYRAMESRVLDAVAAAGFDDVTAAQGRVFARIGPDGTRVTELAEQARVTKQTAAFLVDQLERAGYVRRMPDPSDARARLVTITARGEAAIRVARAAEAEVEAEWTRHLGRQATSQLRRALTRLREITDPYQ
ncbi:MarR family winged helix-turn-helix transcriptional regulator [Micromonospora sp. ATA51]|uniref:MarR family winged helix-turn-helix transcriptional regulator n=1 Tax=Micromonospora sp. ATA51 TaxID=2806098 RepID=UPI001A4E84EF|nr:MarR family transcriptional regulator [Micromonospora sp. ATA51]MBM0227245.1 MarR family transcriptional regulator [Micromonospora sp. ATA51]